jgi:hypothetical protein
MCKISLIFLKNELAPPLNFLYYHNINDKTSTYQNDAMVLNLFVLSYT